MLTDLWYKWWLRFSNSKYFCYLLFPWSYKLLNQGFEIYNLHKCYGLHYDLSCVNLSVTNGCCCVSNIILKSLFPKLDVIIWDFTTIAVILEEDGFAFGSPDLTSCLYFTSMFVIVVFYNFITGIYIRKYILWY